mmetsp:Transcript_4304/g.11134  ORF Transcript_4304/g.11134 Transcript_4304/m.11134 type:complete len:283 (-) Transcript_4304:64-912(-)
MNYLGYGERKKGKPASPSGMADAFETQAFFVRTKGAGNIESWPDVLTVRGVAEQNDASTSVEVNGSRVRVNDMKLYLRRDKPCCYVCTDVWVFSESVALEICDKDDVWLQCVLKLHPDEENGSSWTLQCKLEEEPEGGDVQPRWELNLEVSLVGKVDGFPCFLSQTAKTTRKIRAGRRPSMKSITEDENASSTVEEHLEKEQNSILQMPDFAKQFEQAYSSLGGQGTLTEGGEGELTWFNAGLRIGVGVGLGICLGAGLGAGILMRSYQATTSSLKRRLSTL